MKHSLTYILIFLFGLVEAISQSTFSAQRLEQAAINYLRKQFQSASSPTFLIKFPDVSFESSNIKAKFDYKINEQSSIQKLFILFYEDNDLIRKIEIPFKIKIQTEVVVANRDIPPNSVISENDLVTISRDIDDIDQIITELHQAVGKLAIRRISKGEVVKKNDLQQVKVIKRGQNVNVEVISGNVKIYTTGIAIQDGGVGDVIRLRREIDNTKTTIEGKVVNENLVQIILR